MDFTCQDGYIIGIPSVTPESIDFLQQFLVKLIDGQLFVILYEGFETIILQIIARFILKFGQPVSKGQN